MCITNLRVRKSVLFLLVFLYCIIYYIRWTPKQNEEDLTEGHFWVFTDSHVDVSYQIHSDPASNCHNISLNNITKTVGKFGQLNCDIPSELLYSAFSSLKRIDSNVDFIIWLGDAVSYHDTDQNSIISVYANMSEELQRLFPETLIIPVLGNHDINLKTNRSTRFKELYDGGKFNLFLDDEDVRQTFIKGKCGYYSIRYQSFGRNNHKEKSFLRFVVLNSAMFQPEYMNHFDNNEATDQISWFNQTMSEAINLNDRILLLVHVPFGIDEMVLKKFYDVQYEQKLLSIIDKYSSNIIMCFTGHRHQDTFRLYSSPYTKMGILGHSSISPLDFLTDPSIRYYSYNRKSLILNDYEQYILNLMKTEQTQHDEWLLSYRFSSWYHQPKELTTKTLLKIIYLIKTNSFYRKRFLLTQHYREKILLTSQKIIESLCAITLFNLYELNLCTKFLTKNQHQYKSMMINYSPELDVLIDEEVNPYKILYPYMVIVLAVILLIIYKKFYKSS